jgi:hypothetical protein
MLGLGSKTTIVAATTGFFRYRESENDFPAIIQDIFCIYQTERERDNIVSMHKFTMDQSRSWKKSFVTWAVARDALFHTRASVHW